MPRLPIALLFAAVLLTAAPTAASAATGYELSNTTPSHSLGGSTKAPHGIAVDQANQRIYVAILVDSPIAGTPGRIERFESDLSPAGAFPPDGGFYGGVAVNPLTQGFYAAQGRIQTPLGMLGTSQMDLFSSSGTPGASFALSETGTAPQIATDSSGDVYYPNAFTHTVQVLNSAGVVQEEIGCAGCPGGSTFGKPVSVALDSDDNLYVVDLEPDRVVKLTPSGGGYAYSSTLQSGLGAAAVGVDPSDDTVFVGDMPNSKNYHVAVYNSSGVQFDDFGGGLFADPPTELGAIVAPQIAANATTHKVYIGDAAKLYIFERVISSPPNVTIMSASPVGQVTATLRATVNPHTHTVLDCDFEYVDDADFQATEFADAVSLPCAKNPAGSSNTVVEGQATGLAPSTLYHYRQTTSTFQDSTTSTGKTFSTLPAVPPTVKTTAPSNVTKTSAKLNGTVNPQGGSVSACRFEWGTSTAYGTNVACQNLPQPVTTDVSQNRSISGLTSGITYHYRLVATSNAGTTLGQDVAFTTVSTPTPPVTELPPETEPAPILTPPVTTPPPRPLKCKKGFRKVKVRGKMKCVKKRRHARRKHHRN